MTCSYYTSLFPQLKLVLNRLYFQEHKDHCAGGFSLRLGSGWGGDGVKEEHSAEQGEPKLLLCSELCGQGVDSGGLGQYLQF